MSRLVYVVNARLPTEKAHGYQAVKMCQAFASRGLQVILLHPYRHQPDPVLARSSVHEYYGVVPTFQIRTLPNLDIVRGNSLFPRQLLSAVFFAHALVWGLYAALEARKLKADLYYTRDSPLAYWLVRLGLPTVCEMHVAPRLGQRWVLQRVGRSPALRLVVALTPFIKERLVNMRFPSQKILVLPDGVDLSRFEGLPSKGECRRTLELPQARFIVGYVGRFRTLEMEKGLPELVESMAHLSSVNGSQPLLLCVGGPMEAVAAYMKLARRLGVPEERLKFVDHVTSSRVPRWIRACDVVVIPWPWTEFSAYFTSPLKLFEYLAAGVPIVASDLPSLREILRHGENAWLVEPGSPAALARGVQRLLEDQELAARLASQGLRDVQRYTWDRRAGNILEGTSMGFSSSDDAYKAENASNRWSW